MAVVVAASVSTGCDDVEAALADISDELRGNDVERGRAGTLAALHVGRQAHRLAAGMADAPDPRCALEIPAGSHTHVIDITIEREGREGQSVEWYETRILRRDDDGDVTLEMNADYRNRLGLEGDQWREARLVGSEVYTARREGAYYHREAVRDDRSRITASATGVFQSALDSANDGWTASEDGFTWEQAGEALRCGPRDPTEAGWLRQLDTRGEVVSGKIEVGDDTSSTTRQLALRWLLSDGVAMTMELHERVRTDSVDVTAPPDPSIHEVERTRDWWRTNRLLDEFVDAGWVEHSPGNDVKRGDETGERSDGQK